MSADSTLQFKDHKINQQDHEKTHTHTTLKIPFHELQHHCSLHGTVLVHSAVTFGDKKT
jgi:hypothetical protein